MKKKQPKLWKAFYCLTILKQLKGDASNGTQQEEKICGQESVNILPQPQYYSANQVSFVCHGIPAATPAKYRLDKPTTRVVENWKDY